MNNSRIRAYGIHVLFLVGLFVAYLFMLFQVAHISDIGVFKHSAVRVLVAMLELAFWGCLMLYPLHRWWRRRQTGWFILYMVVAVFVCLIYVSQLYSLYLSNNFISILGMQNMHYARFTRTSMEGVMYGAAIIWLALLGICTWWTALPSTQGSLGALAAFLVLLVLYAGVFTMQRRHVTLEPDFRQAPVASILVNASLAYVGGRYPTALSRPINVAGDRECFRDPHAGRVAGYPFQKNIVYDRPLPYPRRAGTTKRPNVIWIFTEGLSARLLGAYGGPYPGLTPHIDDLANHSMTMKVTNYYNQTAATYRGIIGQSSSGYSFKGGGGKGGWVNGNNADKLATIRRQTVADILNGKGYFTAFFEPEHTGSAFGKMLRSLGFRHLFTFNKISRLLGGHVVIQNSTDQLDDESLYHGLVVYLKKYQSQPKAKPFFIGIYNIGTHAFIPMVAGGHAYKRYPNRFLNKLHNYDYALGSFFKYFFASPYAKNTILVFSADHATYPNRPYRDVAGKNLAPYFVDRVPLLIYDPTHKLPRTFNAHGRDSVSLAPTLLQLLGVNHVPNSFMGASLFEQRAFAVGMTAIGTHFYVTLPHRIEPIWSVPARLKKMANCEEAVIDKYYQLGSTNHLFKPTHGSASTVAATAQPIFKFKMPIIPHLGSPRCALDTLDGKTIVHNGRDVNLPRGRPFLATGWLVNRWHNAASSKMWIVLKPVGGGKTRRFAVTKPGVRRPDVAKALMSAGAVSSGFSVKANSKGLAPGRYHVLGQAGEGKSSFACSFNVTFSIPTKQ